jgi:hypothetical protein
VTRGEWTDHPWIAADRSSRPSSGNLYVAFSVGDKKSLGFSRSTDAGRTFEPPRRIAAADAGTIAVPMVATGRDGLVCAVYGVWPPQDGAEPVEGRRPELVGPVMVLCSTDYGETFGEPIELGQGVMDVWLPGEASSPALPAIAADWSSDAIYAAFAVRQPDSEHTSVVAAASYDRGHTWTAANPVSPDIEGVHYFQPQIAVDADGGVGVSAFALEQGLVGVELFVSDPGALSFSAPARVTPEPFDPGAVGSLTCCGGKERTWWIGDYQGLTGTSEAFHLLWNDTRTGQLELFTAAVPTGGTS